MITYKQNPQLDFQAVLCLYASVGWTNYTTCPERLQKALENTLLVLAAFDGEQLVGLLRAVGDSYSIVFIQDILVLPAYQRQGIGRQLLEQAITHFPEIYQLHLLTTIQRRHGLFMRNLALQLLKDWTVSFTPI